MSAQIPFSDLALCPGNCSGKGVCVSGTCLCQVQYSGWNCNERNLGYFLSFGIIFYVVCFAAIIQLILCIRSDFSKLKRPSIIQACRLNIQKLVYISVICATGSRALYFIIGLQDLIPESWKHDFFPLFYTFVLSGFSLIICFWAESFHLSGLQYDRPRFLTKSYFGFVAFNVLVYVLVIGQVLSNHFLPKPLLAKAREIFNGCFAFLMFFVLVFFLIYGVEIFCKVEGAFKINSPTTNAKQIDLRQLFQSRFGLIAQAAFQLLVTGFLLCEVLGRMWKRKISIGDRNIMEIAFHVAELACVLWFPCCLWNVSRPGDLWILNPKTLFKLRRNTEQSSLVRDTPSPPSYNTFADTISRDEKEEASDVDEEEEGECWICCDTDSDDQLIRPCDCKGSMGLVHHDCLKKWLMEKASNGGEKEIVSCRICKVQYNVTSDSSMLWSPTGLQVKAWCQSFVVIATMASFPVALFFMWKKISLAPIKVCLIAVVFIGEYFLLRLLGINYVKVYKLTKTRAMKILGRSKNLSKSQGSSRTGSSCSTASEVDSHLSIAVQT